MLEETNPSRKEYVYLDVRHVGRIGRRLILFHDLCR